MKKLIILRHAKSSWDYPELSDYERPLNSRGNKDAEMMSLKLSERLDHIDSTILSSSKRTELTYEYFKNKINFKSEFFTDQLFVDLDQPCDYLRFKKKSVTCVLTSSNETKKELSTNRKNA